MREVDTLLLCRQACRLDGILATAPAASSAAAAAADTHSKSLGRASRGRAREEKERKRKKKRKRSCRPKHARQSMQVINKASIDLINHLHARVLTYADKEDSMQKAAW
jgi:hypothetical protein